jgi:lysophospholipase L1-like esterase
MPVIHEINAALAKLADGDKVRFLALNDRLVDSRGNLLDGMMNPDKLHPSVRAYQVWADALRPVLTELLGAPAKEDLAPSPTGDPSAR